MFHQVKLGKYSLDIIPSGGRNIEEKKKQINFWISCRAGATLQHNLRCPAPQGGFSFLSAAHQIGELLFLSLSLQFRASLGVSLSSPLLFSTPPPPAFPLSLPALNLSSCSYSEREVR